MSTSSTDGEGEERPPPEPPLILLRQAKSLLRRLGKRPLKSLGQHFLVDTGVLGKIVEAARLTKHDTVIEVGPGLGILTQELARHVDRVIAVELDPVLAGFLRQTLAPYKNVTIVQADILRTDPAALLQGSGFRVQGTEGGQGSGVKGQEEGLGSRVQGSRETGSTLDSRLSTLDPRPYKVVADLPYNIAAPTLRHFLEAEAKPELIVVMVQREVARRIAAEPGDMSPLSIGIQLYGHPTIAAIVPPRCFYPSPKVHSAILRIEVHPKPAVDVPPDSLFRVVRAGFGQPRKQLRNTLAAGLGLKPPEAESLLAEAGIDARRRPETLSLEEWAALAQVVTEALPD